MRPFHLVAVGVEGTVGDLELIALEGAMAQWADSLGQVRTAAHGVEEVWASVLP